VATNGGLNVSPFIRVYNRMFKNGANSAMDLKTFGNSNSNVNSDVLIRLDSGGDPTPGANSGKIIYNINGSDKHIMTSSGLGINITSPGIFALNVNGDSMLANILNVSGFTTLNNNVTLISSLNVSGFSTFSNNTTLVSSLNVSGFATLNNNATLLSSLNVSGFTTLNNTTLLSSLNVSGFTTLNNSATFLSSLNVSGFTTLNNNTTLLSSLNVSGFTRLNNDTTLLSSLNISGFTTLNNNTTLLSSLNISGRTIIGNDVYNYNDSVLELYKNLTVRKNVTSIGGSFIGDMISIKVGEGNDSSYISLAQAGDINIQTQNYTTSNAVITLTSNKFITLNSPETVISNDLKINGLVSGINIGVKSPLFFTTNRNMTINGISFSVYDIDLRKYTKAVSLDGYNIRQFRIRHWPANGDFETGPSSYQYHLKRYDIFMSNRNGLNLYSLSSPLDNQFLTETVQTHFLYRNTFDYLIYCSRYGAVKVYFIIEDLL
jgi:hypothetical protein